MKCVSIVYRRPNSQCMTPQLIPVRTIRRSVDQYLQKLKDKQQHQKFSLQTEGKTLRPQLKTMQTLRANRVSQFSQMPDSINIRTIKYSTQNIFKQEGNPQFYQEKKQRKFRSTFIKNKQQKESFSFKGIRNTNQGLFGENRVKPLSNRGSETYKNASKLLNLRKLKLSKPNTILISVDFILNETNFWQEQRIEEGAHKNWRLLQQHSNIVWLTKRQSSSRKLQKFAAEYGLRLDGVYKIMPSKRGQTLVVSLGMFQKDFRIQSQLLKMKQIKKEVIVINSLRVDQLKDVGYQQFYSSFPVVKSMRCVVHFIQVDMDDKNRFNSPLKILSKDKLPAPNSVSHLFLQFYQDHQLNPQQQVQLYMQDLNNIQTDQESQISKDEMMQKYEEIKQDFVNYFGNHLKINLNRKLKIQENQCSVQYIIGDMLRRNFNIMCGYYKECGKIKTKMQKIRQKHKNISDHPEPKYQNKLNNFFNTPNLQAPQQKPDLNYLIRSKLGESNLNSQNLLSRRKGAHSKQEYKEPVFLWKK